MPGEPIRIGPFVKGLNTFSDPSAVSDDQLVECLNFEPDFDGSIKSRPPVSWTGNSMTLGATGNPRILGSFTGAGATPFIIASDGASSTYYYDGSSWILITNTIAASAMTQFDNKAWLLAPVGSTNPGGTWSPTAGFVAEPNMPRGEIIISNKLRLWVALGKDATSNGTRLYFSKVLGQPEFWLAFPDFIDIGGGDGQNIVQAMVYYQSIVLFRTDSIYSYTYTTDPANGVVNLTVPGIGLTNKDCIVTYENYIYFMYEGRAYEFVNARANQINVQVPFYESTQLNIVFPFSVSFFNQRILFQWWDTTYVFYLRTRTWTRWRSTEHSSFGKMFQRVRSEDIPEAILFSNIRVIDGSSRVAKTLTMQDAFNVRTEQFICTMQTKTYNYETSTVFKRLFWWGIDAQYQGQVTGIVSAINFSTASTWGQLRQGGNTWGATKLKTWGSLSSDTYIQTSVRTSPGRGALQKTTKMGTVSLRAKQMYFIVSFNTDGSAATAPVRLNSLMTYVRAKQTVSKTVS